MKPVPATVGVSFSVVDNVRFLRGIHQHQGARGDVALLHHPVQRVDVHVGGESEQIVNEPGHFDLADRSMAFQHFHRHHVAGPDCQHVGERLRKHDAAGGKADRFAVAVDDPFETWSRRHAGDGEVSLAMCGAHANGDGTLRFDRDDSGQAAERVPGGVCFGARRS